MGMEISLCMIVRDEEAVLARCLSGIVDAVDEVIVVDTGSLDSTKQIAASFGEKVKVFDFTWVNDFSAARNFSFAQASKPYIMWLDADDTVSQQEAARLVELKETLDEKYSAVYMRYAHAFDSFGNPTFVYRRERLFRRDLAPVWQGAVHETVQFVGEWMDSDILIEHHKHKLGVDLDRNLKIYEGLVASGRQLTARDTFYMCRELMFNGRYDEAVQGFEGFLELSDAWVENRISACLDLANCWLALGQRQQALDALTRALGMDTPRAEICCEIGAWWMEAGHFAVAAGWYLAAASQTPDISQGAFVNLDMYSFVPYMQLCVCYDRLGDYALARHYNGLAGMQKPNDPTFLANVEYFGKLGGL